MPKRSKHLLKLIYRTLPVLIFGFIAVSIWSFRLSYEQEVYINFGLDSFPGSRLCKTNLPR